MRRVLMILVVPTVLSSSVLASGKGQGGCVIHDLAPIYAKSEGEKIEAKGQIGDCMAGITTRGILGNEFVFEKENGRVHVAYFANKEQKGLYRTAWMNPADLSTFTYECGCGSSKKNREGCTPLQGMMSFEWNPCFTEGRDKKLEDLNRQPQANAAAPASATASPEGSATAKRPEKALRNDDILSLVKVGLDDNLIISKIQAAEATNFDLSTEGIVALKTAKVSNAVIDAMMKRVGK
jgi:hypothetical protein